jgi:glutamate dehydrogenase/leucine dehydrogenase
LNSFLVIDSLGPGGACGGIRITEDLTAEEVVALARTMTLKYRFLGVIPVGGAKAGIAMPSDLRLEQREKILEAFGRQAAPLLKNRIYNPWTDMNTGPRELNQVLAGAGLPPRRWPDSGYYTALTVTAALKAVCEAREIGMNGLTACVEGFGNVGGHVVRELHQLGVRVVGISTAEGAVYDSEGLDVPTLLRLRPIHAARVIHYAAGSRLSRESLLELPVDVLIPAAAAWTINSKNADKIKCRVIVPAANIPVSEEAKEVLSRSDTRLLPDFVCNSGGALGSYLESCGMEPGKIRQILLGDFKFAVKNLISQGELDNPPDQALKTLSVVQTRKGGSFPVRAARVFARLLKRPGPSRVPIGWTNRKARAASRFRNE